MSNLHPTIAAALVPMTPPASFQRCSHMAPRPKRGTQRFCYTLGEVDLECDVEYEKASKGSWSEGQQMEPDEPESATLCAAYVRDVDVLTMLDDDQIAKIEEAFLEQEWAL